MKFRCTFVSCKVSSLAVWVLEQGLTYECECLSKENGTRRWCPVLSFAQWQCYCSYSLVPLFRRSFVWPVDLVKLVAFFVTCEISCLWRSGYCLRSLFSSACAILWKFWNGDLVCVGVLPLGSYIYQIISIVGSFQVKKRADELDIEHYKCYLNFI